MSREPSSLPPDRLLQPTTAKWLAVIFGTSLVYALVPLFVKRKLVREKRMREEQKQRVPSRSEG